MSARDGGRRPGWGAVPDATARRGAWEIRSPGAGLDWYDLFALEWEDLPVDATVRSAARRDDSGRQPAPSTLRAATSALLRRVFQRASAEIPYDFEGSPVGPGLVPGDSGTGSGDSPSHARGQSSPDGSWLTADGQSGGAGPGNGEAPPGDDRRAASVDTGSASAGGACANVASRNSGRASGTVADGQDEPDPERTVAVVNGPGAGRSAPEPAAPEERPDDTEGAARRARPPSDSKADRGERTLDGAAAGITDLGDRLRSLEVPGWNGRDAEWLALACLHGGVFLRPQYLAFAGQSHPELARRFVRRCRKAAVEERWNASGLKLCRIVDRELYRELGVQHLHPRRDATMAVVLRRLLALDYVIDHLDAPWLPTDDEKVAAFTAAGVPKNLWPGRVYVGAAGARRRPFVHRLPLALDAGRAIFVFVQPEEETQSALRTWGGQHAGLWAALLAAGRAVDVVVVGRDRERLAAAGRVLDGWVSSTAAADGRHGAVAAEVAERVRRDEEIASIRTTIATLDHAMLAAYGGLNGAVARCAALETDAAKATRVKPMISTGRTWPSQRVPE